MEHFAQGIVAGFAISSTIPAMYYFNKAALGTLFAINEAIGKAIVRVIIPPPPEIRYDDLKHTCNDDDDDDDCTQSIVCCNNCESTELKLKRKYTSPCLTTSS